MSVYADNDSFKVYMVDTGLLCSKFDIAANTVLNSPPSFDGFKGALADNVRAKSLKVFIALYEPPYAIRVSAKNFGFENGIKSIPLYALFCLKP